MTYKFEIKAPATVEQEAAVRTLQASYRADVRSFAHSVWEELQDGDGTDDAELEALDSHAENFCVYTSAHYLILQCSDTSPDEAMDGISCPSDYRDFSDVISKVAFFTFLHDMGKELNLLRTDWDAEKAELEASK